MRRFRTLPCISYILHESSWLLALLLQAPSPELDVQMSLSCLNTPEFPGNIGEISGPLLHVGNRLWSEDSAGGFFLKGIVVDDCIGGKEGPFGGGCVELGEAEGGLVECME